MSGIAGSATFKGEANKIWGVVLKTVAGAGYAIVKTDQAAKQLTYDAKGNATAGPQRLEVSVTELGPDETLVSATCRGLQQIGLLTQHVHQNALIKFLFDEVSKAFPVVEMKANPSAAPGTENLQGCLGLFSAGMVLFALISVGLWAL